jgi:para-nitrobenzyl esterase
VRTLVAVCAALLAVGFGAEASAQTVTVTGGVIRGAMLENGGAVFRGIPYAAPPVGELRWREPMPVKPWTSVRDATAFGAICAQVPTPLESTNVADPGSEDCLFVNVWTPEWPSTSGKPVMVWIHGGANYAGSGSLGGSDGESLARRGVVVVTINYRLGPFGFFSHPALTRESPNRASGNQGLLDQIAALKWVRDNIAGFGGDPDNVTVFGVSAGAIDIAALMTSPLARGLFERVIGESGAANQGNQFTLSQAEQRGEILASAWKAPRGASIRDLRAVSTSDILKVYAEPGTLLRPNGTITIDGHVLPKKPADVFAAGEQLLVPILLGSNTRDRFTPLPGDMRTAITELYVPLAERAHALYVGPNDPVYGTLVEQWVVDTTFRCSAVAQLEWHATAGNPAYEYEFARVPPGREILGATHGSEVPYVFATFDSYVFDPRYAAAARVAVGRANDVDRQVSDVMQQYWTNFAKTGDPNGAGLPVWLRFDPEKRAYIQFTDTGPVAKEGLRRPYCDLFIENVKREMAR